MDKKTTIIKDAFQLTFARYFTQGLGFFTSIAMRRFLGPYYIGIWSLLRVIFDYTAYLLLGINDGLTYKIPFLAGKDNAEKEETIKDSAFSFVFLVSALTGAALFITAVILRNNYPTEIITGLLILSIYIILERLCGFYMTMLRARKNFSVLSKTIMLDAVLNLILIFLLVKNYKIYGLYFTVMATSIMNIVFMHLLAKYKINLNFSFRGVGDLIKTGFPITILGLLEWVLGSTDKIMIAKMIGITFVGYYSISLMTKSYVTQLSSFGTVLYPHLLHDYGKNERIDDIKKYVLIPPKINAYLLPILLGTIFFTAPLLIKLILPKFIPGIIAIQILLIDMYFRACFTQATHFIVALKKQVKIIPILVFSIILNFAGDFILIKKGFGINGVAGVTSFISFFTFIAIQGYAMKHFAGAKEITLFIIMLMVPFFYAATTVLILQKAILLTNVYMEALVRVIFFTVVYLPMLFYINKETKIINFVFGMLKESVFKKSSRW